MLKDYQKEIYAEARSILDKYGLVYLALAPRLGKSYIASALIDTDDCLVVTRKKAISGFEKALKDMNKNATVVNYEQLNKISKCYELVIIDEAHSIKKYPKPSKRYKDLKSIIKDRVILLSGTPAIESSPDLYHQFAICPNHYWSKYRNFYAWHKEYGIQGLLKYTGGAYPVTDYSQVINFTEEIKPYTINMFSEEMLPKIEEYKPYWEAIEPLYRMLNKDKVLPHFNVSVSGGADLFYKQLQLGGGTIIDDYSNQFIVSKEIAMQVHQKYPDSAIFYKFRKELELLAKFYPKTQLFQIDSSSMGVDLSRFKSAVIYTPTLSGSNFVQCLYRLTNINSNSKPIYTILTHTPALKKAYRHLFAKLNENIRRLK